MIKSNTSAHYILIRWSMHLKLANLNISCLCGRSNKMSINTGGVKHYCGLTCMQNTSTTRNVTQNGIRLTLLWIIFSRVIPSKACFTEHLHRAGIYQVYVCHIHSARLFLFSCTLQGLPGFARLRPAIAAKVLHPGVGLINMAATACSLAWTISTTEFDGLLLSWFYDITFIILW